MNGSDIEARARRIAPKLAIRRNTGAPPLTDVFGFEAREFHADCPNCGKTAGYVLSARDWPALPDALANGEGARASLAYSIAAPHEMPGDVGYCDGSGMLPDWRFDEGYRFE